MNKFDTYITDYLYENREVALEKIGFIKIISFPEQDTKQAAADYIFDKRITTSTALIEYIAEKTGKNKKLIAADLESHFAGVREFINIGKPYEIPQIGFIKANNRGIYEFSPFSETNKPVRTKTQPVKQKGGSNNRAAIQVISLIIAIAILSGLGWEAYQVFSNKNKNVVADTVANADTTAVIVTNKVIDTTSQKPAGYLPGDSADVKYIYETTASGLRARTRTAQLKRFGSNAGYDSFETNSTMHFELYIIQRTKIADTLTVKDSLSKFLMKDVRLRIDSAK